MKKSKNWWTWSAMYLILILAVIPALADDYSEEIIEETLTEGWIGEYYNDETLIEDVLQPEIEESIIELETSDMSDQEEIIEISGEEAELLLDSHNGSVRYGTELYWEIDDNGVLRIYGNGAIPDYSYSTLYNRGTAPWCEFANEIKEIVIEEGVTHIGKSAFELCKNVKSVSIASSVVSIGRSAFIYCSNLLNVVLPDSIASIDYGAFQYCSSLQTIKLSSNLKQLSDNLFYGCSLLKSIMIPEGVERIGVCCFEDCNALSKVSLPSSIKTIEKRAFQHCSFSEISLPLDLSMIGEQAFAGNQSLNSIEIPENVHTIGNGAFWGCNNLRKAVIHSSNEMGDEVFYYCSSLNEVVLPETVSSMGGSFFKECKSLTYVDLPEGLTGIKQDFFFGCTNLRYINLGTDIQQIGKQAFKGCQSLETITIPPNVQSIPEFAFEDCINLKEIYITSASTQIDSNAFYYVKPEPKIIAPLGSSAEAYAKKWGLRFMDINHKHSHQIMPKREATCERDGLTQGEKCPVCGEVFIEQKIIPAKGHSFVINIAPGKTVGIHCSICQKVFVAQKNDPMASSSEGSFTVTAKGLKNNKITLKKGKSIKLKISGAFSKVTYSSSNKKIATVSVSGKIKARKKGKATITVKSGGKTKKIKITVK